MFQPRQEEIEIVHETSHRGRERSEGTLHALQEDGAHDADEVGVALPQLRTGLLLPCLNAVLVQAVDGEVEVLNGVDDVVVDVSVQALQAVVHRLRYLVLREVHSAAR